MSTSKSRKNEEQPQETSEQVEDLAAKVAPDTSSDVRGGAYPMGATDHAWGVVAPKPGARGG